MGNFGSSVPIGLPEDILSRLGIGNKTYVKYKTGQDPDRTGFGLSQFQANVNKRGLSRQNHFLVQIYLPKLGEVTRLVSLFCSASEMPGISVASSPQLIHGYQYEVPYGVVYPDVNMSFYVDGSSIVKGFFDQWITQIFPKTGSNRYDLQYPINYTGTIEITQLNFETTETYKIKLNNVFPKSIGTLNYDHSPNANIVQLPVSFTYKSWEVIKAPREVHEKTVTNFMNNDIGGYSLDAIFGSAKKIADNTVNVFNEATIGISKLFS